MALTHRVLKQHRLVLIIGSSVVGADDIVANRRALLSDPDFDPTFDALVDFTRVPEARVNLDAIRTLSREPLFSGASRIAVVPAVPGKVALFEIARMYETTARSQPWEITCAFSKLLSKLASGLVEAPPCPERLPSTRRFAITTGAAERNWEHDSGNLLVFPTR
jgi:hypothetical protein